ncbi:MAG: hypothetical protein KGQ46_00850 [Hyphomicrobiales bacterium]|nr:hypothetical protein [Hyphomicrobiales bacterium]MDE2114823.1 hypothetical protein [Hyphomicrobiales bacterium]
MTLYTLRLRANTTLADNRGVAARRTATSPAQLYLLAAAISLALVSYLFSQIRGAHIWRQTVADAPQGVVGHAAPDHAWVPISEPFKRYSLESRRFGNAPAHYYAAREQGGQGRMDALEFGDIQTPAPYLSMAIATLAQTTPAGRAAFTPDGEITNSFGQIHYAAQPAKAGPARTCLYFDWTHDEPSVHVSGVACPHVGAATLTPQAMACLMQRLDLNGAADERPLRQYFVMAELRQDHYCLGAQYVVAASPNP